MANCNCIAMVTSADFDTNTKRFQILLRLAYGGTDVPGGGDVADLTVEMVPTESVQQGIGRITQAIQAHATSRGFTVSANNLIITGLAKGI